jgi:hypothetical protein
MRPVKTAPTTKVTNSTVLSGAVGEINQAEIARPVNDPMMSPLRSPIPEAAKHFTRGHDRDRPFAMGAITAATPEAITAPITTPNTGRSDREIAALAASRLSQKRAPIPSQKDIVM